MYASVFECHVTLWLYLSILHTYLRYLSGERKGKGEKRQRKENSMCVGYGWGGHRVKLFVEYNIVSN